MTAWLTGAEWCLDPEPYTWIHLLGSFVAKHERPNMRAVREVAS